MKMMATANRPRNPSKPHATAPTTRRVSPDTSSRPTSSASSTSYRPVSSASVTSAGRRDAVATAQRRDKQRWDQEEAAPAMELPAPVAVDVAPPPRHAKRPEVRTRLASFESPPPSPALSPVRAGDATSPLSLCSTASGLPAMPALPNNGLPPAARPGMFGPVTASVLNDPAAPAAASRASPNPNPKPNPNPGAGAATRRWLRVHGRRRKASPSTPRRFRQSTSMRRSLPASRRRAQARSKSVDASRRTAPKLHATFSAAEQSHKPPPRRTTTTVAWSLKWYTHVMELRQHTKDSVAHQRRQQLQKEHDELAALDAAKRRPLVTPDRLYWAEMLQRARRDTHLQVERQKKLDAEMAECTFRPSVRATAAPPPPPPGVCVAPSMKELRQSVASVLQGSLPTAASVSSAGASSQGADVRGPGDWRRRRAAQRAARLAAVRQAETAECTFQPNVSRRTAAARRVVAPAPPLPPPASDHQDLINATLSLARNVLGGSLI